MLHYGRRWSQRWLRRHNEATKRASSKQSGQHYFLMTTCVLALLELGNGCSIYVDDDIRTMTGAIAMQTNFLHWWACILINYTVLATMPYPGSKSCRRGSAAVSWDGSVIMHLQTMEPAGGDQSFSTAVKVHQWELELRLPGIPGRKDDVIHRAGRPLPTSGKHLSINPTTACQSDDDSLHLQQWWRCGWWQRNMVVWWHVMAQYGR